MPDYEKENREAMSKEWELLPAQRQNVYAQSYAPGDSFLNLHSMIKLKAGVDQKRMEEAVNLVLKEHPCLCMNVYADEDTGIYYQKYEPSFAVPAGTEELSEEALPERIRELNAPFSLGKERLYRCGLIRTEEGLYLYMVLHHTITDQSALNLMMLQFLQSYQKGAYAGEKDHYFYLLKQHAERKEAESYEEARSYFGALFDERSKSVPLGVRIDHESKDRTLATILHSIERKENRDVNFLKTAAVLAAAWYNGTQFAFLQAINADRPDPLRSASAGFFAAMLTVGLVLGGDESPKALLSQIKEQNRFARAHTEYSYMQDKIGDASLMMRFNYQKDGLGWIRETDLPEKVMKFPESSVMTGVMGLSFVDSQQSGKIHLFLRYALACYEKESMERYLELFNDAVKYLEET